MNYTETEGFESMSVEYLLTEKRNALGMSLDDIARGTYPDEEIGKARMKLYRLRKPQKSTGASRRITLNEFMAICKAMGLNPVQEFAVVLDRFEQKK
jgi:hypothetical protein